MLLHQPVPLLTIPIPIRHSLFVIMSIDIKNLEKDLTALQKSRALIRTQSPVLLQWPWENGIALERGSMRERLELCLQGSPRDSRLIEMVTVSFTLSL
jgi:hypothetical protein